MFSSNNFTVLALTFRYLIHSDNREGYACVGVGSVSEISVLSFQFSSEPKTALQK